MINLQWLPIESAPMDGSAVLIVAPGYRSVMAQFEREAWRYPFSQFGRKISFTPTLWMPRPLGPDEEPLP